MKSIHVIIPRDKERVVKTILDKLNFQYFLLNTQTHLLFIINVTDEKVENLIDNLRSVGVGQLYGTYIIYEVSYPFVEEAEIIEAERVTRRVSREEILSRIRDDAVLSRNYIIFTISAAIIATLGLLTDNVVMIVASMIIDPLMAPILGTSMGIVLNLEDLRKESLKSETFGLLLDILTGFIITLLLPYSTVTKEMILRAYPSVLDIIFALTAGIAAALSTVSAEVMTLVGVAIAASLLPPATNIGIGIAYLVKGVPTAKTLIIGSSALLAINILAITIASVTFFWFVGIRPGESIRKMMLAERRLKKRLILIIVAFLVISVPLIITSIQYYKSEKIELSVRKETLEFLNKYAPEADVISLDVKYLTDIDTVQIFLSIGVENVTEKILKLPEALAKHINEELNLKADVYMQIYLAYRESSIGRS